MMKEERVLFPMIKQGAGRGAAMPIQMMMHEHSEHEAALAELRALTDDFTPPEGACGSWQRLYALAKELSDDLNDHIALENDILFALRVGFIIAAPNSCMGFECSPQAV